MSRHWLEPELVTIPAGPFLMGSDQGQEDEQPVHEVWLDAFAIARYPASNCQYRCFVADGGPAPPFWNEPRFADPDQPVVGVNWYDAVAYGAWLSQVTGRLYQLPSEAQREKAARGGLEGQEYPWGNVIPDTVPVKGGRDSRPPQAGSTPPNGYGLYHLADGVHEWCADWYRPGYYASAPRHNPPGPPTGQRRSARGGSWRHHFAVSRCAARSSLGPAYRYSDFGFRCASPSP